MDPRRITTHFDRLTNVAVLVGAVLLVALFARSYFPKAAPKPYPDPMRRGTVLRKIDGVDLHQSMRTLILALSTNCRYCTQSMPFYKGLTQRIDTEAGKSTQLVALFPESRQAVDSYLQSHQLTVKSVPGVSYGALKIPFTPSLILVDSNGEVLSSWGGTLSADEQKDVYAAISPPAPISLKPAHSGSAEVSQTISLFDENSPLVEIRPSEELLGPSPADEKLLTAVRRQINQLSVDQEGNIYLVLWHKIIEYTGAGKLVRVTEVPEGFKGAFCVDDHGELYVACEAGISRYDQAASRTLVVPVARLPYSPQSYVLKMDYDRDFKKLYLQIYDPVAVSQSLVSLDPATGETRKIHRQTRQVKFTPAYAPGAFDFALGADQIFVSDIYEYKVHIYSKRTGQYLTEFHKSAPLRPIGERDGYLVNRKMTVGNLVGASLLKNYPPILHLGVASQGNLTVWTSQRDQQLRQKVDVYDRELNLLGVDFKYAHPTISNYVFANDKVYVPDFGFGRAFQNQDVSPLDVPSKALGVKVFKDSLHRI